MQKLTVGLTSDFVDEAGTVRLDAPALDRLRAAGGIELRKIVGRPSNAPLEPADLAAYDVLVTKRNRLDAALLADQGMRLRHVARMGVGFDHIDIDACSRAGVTVSITPDAVRRPVASGILASMLALAHQLPGRDRLARAGDWSTRFALRAPGLAGRTLGLIGVGNIGREVLQLTAPFGLRVLASDPGLGEAEMAGLGATALPLDELLRQADFVVLACLLNKQTRRLIDRRRLALMREDAFLINIARGELVEEEALVEALEEKRIAGAAIDVFEQEPPAAGNRLLTLPNVIVGQHNLGMTDEVDRLGHAAVAEAVLAVKAGRMPDHTINPGAWPRAQGKLPA